jgi:hypothetical protein
VPLTETLFPLSGDFSDPNPILNGRCEGASPELSHFFFAIEKGTSYRPGDPIPSGASANIYEAYLKKGEPTLTLLQRDRNNTVYGGGCGATIGGRPDANVFQRGAISADAERVYFTTTPGQLGNSCNTTANKRRIMVRRQTPTGAEISELISNQCSRTTPPCGTVDGDDLYLGASQEGSRVYFSTSRQLADSDKDTTADLYLYDESQPAVQGNVASSLTQVSAGDDASPTLGEDSGFLGLADFSGDGSHAYFVATGILTDTLSPTGVAAQEGQPNLYLYERDADFPSGHTTFVASLTFADQATWSYTPGEKNQAISLPRFNPNLADPTAGGNGHELMFLTHAKLDPFDTDDKADLYRYDSETGSLTQLSIPTQGIGGNGPYDISLTGRYIFAGSGPHDSSFSRWVSEDGTTLVFLTAESLVPEDNDITNDAYLWHQGSLSVLPTARGLGIEPTVSLAGDEVAFVAEDALLPEDGDGAKDVYLARVNGGYAIPNPPPACEEEACQGPAPPLPGDQGATTGAVQPGNPKPANPCSRHKVRKHGKCVSSRKKKKKRKPSHLGRNAAGVRK